MDRDADIKDFIERLKQPEFEERKIEFLKWCNRKSNKWSRNNPQKHQSYVKKYSETEKGIYASSRRNSHRNSKFKEACVDLSWEEKQLIGRFYKNCPQGYEVDHIYPVSKGGKHCLSNLQYLTKEENRRKSNKLNY